jgi:hypothetical protein
VGQPERATGHAFDEQATSNPPVNHNHAMDEAEVDQPSIASTSRHKHESSNGLLSKLPFLRTSPEGKTRRVQNDDHPTSPSRSMATVVQQQKSRPRKGSLRKVALLGRGAQRERRESKGLSIETKHQFSYSKDEPRDAPAAMSEPDHDGMDLEITDITPRPSMDEFANRASLSKSSESSNLVPSRHHDSESLITSPTISYTSTTDEEDVLHIPAHNPSPLRPDLSLSSGSDSYFAANRVAAQRRRSTQQAKSPLSYSGLSTTPWWGWVVLAVTWFVFVTGMGSCLGVWSWAWDVGTTPYAPPELEDDPTLPIVGYYPALIILTCVMAWVWVVVAWVGMKYFRHAKISGD